MCKKLLRSDGQQRSYGKAKFPSNLNCGQKTLVKRAPDPFQHQPVIDIDSSLQRSNMIIYKEQNEFSNVY